MLRLLYFIISTLFYPFIYYFFCNYDDFYFRHPPSNNQLPFLDLIYFSVITQSTIGFGDITPKSNKGKCIVILQVLTSFIIITTPMDYLIIHFK
jgi:hypothetical protein